MRESIEKDIEVLIRLSVCLSLDPEEEPDNVESAKAIDNILAEYNRLLKENTEIKHKFDKAISDLVESEIDIKRLKILLNGDLYKDYEYYRNLADEYQKNYIPKYKVTNIIDDLTDRIKQIQKDSKSCNDRVEGRILSDELQSLRRMKDIMQSLIREN